MSKSCRSCSLPGGPPPPSEVAPPHRRGTNSRFRASAAPVLLLLAACLDVSAPELLELKAPLLLTPQAGAPIRQNDPTIGCAFHVTHGYGFQVPFTWSPVAGAAGYRLLVQRVGAAFPIVDAVVAEPSYLHRSCNAYVIEVNRLDWQWSVSAISSDGSQGTWAILGTFEFGPMSRPPQP